jgi:hypothetical protein
MGDQSQSELHRQVGLSTLGREDKTWYFTGDARRHSMDKCKYELENQNRKEYEGMRMGIGLVMSHLKTC